MKEISVSSLLDTMVPITRFNRGEAARIFDEVEKCDCKVVMKNNRPACVLLSVSRYENMLETISDHALLLDAIKKLKKNCECERLTTEELMTALGINAEQFQNLYKYLHESLTSGGDI